MNLSFHAASKRFLFPFQAAIVITVLASLLAGCGDQSGPSGTQDDDPSGERLEALVHGAVESAYLEPLEKTMNMTTYDGSQKLEDFDILIFDGDANEPVSLKNDGIVRQALQGNKWVLGVDLAENHKRDGLGNILNAASCGDSLAYAMNIAQDYNGRPVVSIVQDKGEVIDLVTGRKEDSNSQNPGPAPELPQLTRETCGTEPTSQVAATRAAPAASAAFADILTEKLTTKLEPLDEPSSFPTDLIYTIYNFTDTKSLVNTCSLRGKCNNGPQTSVVKVNYTYTIFLNNKNNAQGDYQYVLSEMDITTTAASDGNYVNMFGHDGTDWSCCDYDEVSNFVGGIGAETVPGGETGDAWVLQASSPETVNNVTQVTDGVSFSVGFQGEDPSTSFTYSNSVTHNISDWQVDNKTSESQPSWTFGGAYPFNLNLDYGCNPDQDIWADGCWLHSPADLSLYTAQFHTSAYWKTPTIQDEGAFLYNTVWMRVLALACTKNGGIACAGTDYSYADVMLNDTYEINMAAVLPIPIQSLTFSPGASVKGGTNVTGTLALAQPATVDTTISLTSDLENASVPPSVTIKQGQTSADFQILTNANGIPAGGQLVATIKAFYTEFFQAQLTLTN